MMRTRVLFLFALGITAIIVVSILSQFYARDLATHALVLF